jgi:hypothetical protein
MDGNYPSLDVGSTMDGDYPSLDVGSTMDDPYIFITITQSLIWFLGQAEGFFVKKRRVYWRVHYHWKLQTFFHPKKLA